VMESLKRSQFRHVYAICFDEKFIPVLSAAVEVEAIGADFLYVFPSIDKAALQNIVKVEHGKRGGRPTSMRCMLSIGKLICERFLLNLRARIASVSGAPGHRVNQHARRRNN
jgi:hypothetical protein